MTSGRILRWGVGIVALCSGALWLYSADAPAPVKAHLKTKTNPGSDVELLGRTPDKFVRIRAGQAGEIGIPPSDILGLDFIFDLEKHPVQKLYDEFKYNEAARHLQEMLQPTLPYLDVNTNCVPYLRLWVKSQFWDGQYAETVKNCDFLYWLVPDEALKREVQLYRVAAAVPIGKTNDLPNLLKKLEPAARTNDEMAIWWYATAQYQIAQNKLAEAQETTARIIGFRAKDFEWMPAGLYLSARLYGLTKHPEVGKQIVQELKTVFPKSRWAQLAGALDEELDRMPKEEPPKPEESK
jgi:hypothetical protein